ncbi:MAG: hypothetical protein QXQ33_03135 [Nitrososphaerota archaeon]
MPSSSEVRNCSSCRYYAPYFLYPRLGLCSNPLSKLFDYAVAGNEASCDMYEKYSSKKDKLVDYEYYWCEDCLISIPGYLYKDHLSHRIRDKLANTDVEFNAESTFAAD